MYALCQTAFFYKTKLKAFARGKRNADLVKILHLSCEKTLSEKEKMFVCNLRTYMHLHNFTPALNPFPDDKFWTGSN